MSQTHSYGDVKKDSCCLKKYSKTDLQHDFNQMIGLMQQHPALYSFTPESELKDFIKNQYSKINCQMTVPEFFTICAPVIEKVRCTHTWLTLPDHFLDSSNVSIFPLYGMTINDSLIIRTSSDSLSEFEKGTVILEINNIPFSKIIKDLKTFIPSDGFNSTGKNAALNGIFNIYLSIYLGLPATYFIIYKKPKEDTIKSMVVNSAKFNSFKERKLIKKANCDSLLCFEEVKEKQAAILGIHSFVFYNDTARFNKFVDSCFRIVDRQQIPNLILDLRQNSGGDPFCASYLLSYLAQKPFVYYAEPYEWYPTLSRFISPKTNAFKGKLYVLIGGNCLSSSGHLIALMKYHGIGVLVGEETGSTYTCNAYTKWFELDNTKLKVLLARKTFKVAVTGFSKERGIFPDYQVNKNIKNYIMGNDVVLNYTFNLLK